MMVVVWRELVAEFREYVAPLASAGVVIARIVTPAFSMNARGTCPSRSRRPRSCSPQNPHHPQLLEDSVHVRGGSPSTIVASVANLPARRRSASSAGGIKSRTIGANSAAAPLKATSTSTLMRV